MYLELVPIIEARQQMFRIESACLPYQDKERVHRVLNSYGSILGEATGRSRIISDPAEINSNWNLLRMGLIPNG